MTERQRSEQRQRTEIVLVRLTSAEWALVKAVQAHKNARGAGTVLRDAFMEKWSLEVLGPLGVEVLGASGSPPGQPDTTPALPAAQRPAQARASAPEPTSGESAASR
jgi:hypothetical protein